jgi:class 3 adenylate cyclase/CHASE2 domain-containing sensor protein
MRTAPARIPYRVRKYALLVAAGCAVGMLGFGGEGALERFFIDARFLLLSTFRSSAAESAEIAIIREDARSEASLGAPRGIAWRKLYPGMVATLRQAGASLIVFDKMFVGASPEADPGLAKAFREAGNVIAGEEAEVRTPEPLRSSLRSIADLRITLMAGVPRFIAIRADPHALPVLSALVAEERHAARGGTAAWRPRTPGFWINFREPAGHFRSFSFADVYNAADGRCADPERTPLSFFKDRIVLIGLDDPSSLNDRFPLPSTSLLGVRYPGVWSHAFATETVLSGRPVTRAPRAADAAATLGFLLLLCLAMEVQNRAARGACIVLLPLAVFAASQVLLASADLWTGYAPLFVGFWVVLALNWINVRILLAARLRRAVGFDPALIEGFAEERQRAGGALRKDVAIVIADVRGYTHYVATTGPGTVTTVMTEYMDAMERCITAQGGYINKYVGDEIVAVFGYPLAAEESAARAVRAAEGMLRELAALVAAWENRGLPSIHAIGIGIDAGEVAFAEVGGRTKSQFDIIGDCINGASRIQTLTKELHHSLMISEEAYRRIEERDDIAGSFERLGSIPIRGQGERTLYGHVG